MASETRKVLAQVVPAGLTLTDGYTVPATASAVVSSIIVCNQLASATTFRVSVAVAGAADVAKQYLYYDVPLLANVTFAAILGVTLGPSDVVRCFAANGACAFTLFGAETA